MKKYLVLALLGSSMSVYAQPVMEVTTAANVTTSMSKSTTVTDPKTGEKKAVMNPVPNVYIVSPEGADNGASHVAYEEEDSENSRPSMPAKVTPSPLVVPPMPQLPALPAGLPYLNKPGNTNTNINANVPSASKPQGKGASGQSYAQKPSVVYQGISAWNQSSIEAFEAQGKANAEKEYIKFLNEQP